MRFKCTQNAHLSRNLLFSTHLVKNRLWPYFEPFRFSFLREGAHYMQNKGTRLTAQNWLLFLEFWLKKFIQNNKVKFVPNLLSQILILGKDIPDFFVFWWMMMSQFGTLNNNAILYVCRVFSGDQFFHDECDLQNLKLSKKY